MRTTRRRWPGCVNRDRPSGSPTGKQPSTGARHATRLSAVSAPGSRPPAPGGKARVAARRHSLRGFDSCVAPQIVAISGVPGGRSPGIPGTCRRSPARRYTPAESAPAGATHDAPRLTPRAGARQAQPPPQDRIDPADNSRESVPPSQSPGWFAGARLGGALWTTPCDHTPPLVSGQMTVARSPRRRL